MLEYILGSNTRVKILNALILAENNRFSLPELAKKLNITLSATRNELNNLLNFGLIKEDDRDLNILDKGENGRTKKKKFFLVQTDFILYPEIKALLVKGQILSSQKFIDELKKICKPKFLALTGLFTNYPEARTDILLVGSLRRSDFLKLLKKLETELGKEINFTIFKESEFRYREEITDIFLYNILEGKSLILIDNIHK